MPSIQVPESFRIIAHRGASAYAPENTMAAFRLAAEMGARDIEIDVQLSSDGVPVLCHDKTLKRYGNGEGVVESLPSKELLALDMGSWFSAERFKGEKMATLQELLDAFGNRFTYHVELKGSAPELPAKTLEAVRAKGLLGNCVFTSFSKDMLAKARECEPQAKCGWLVDAVSGKRIAAALDLGFSQLCPKADGLVKEEASKALDAGLELRAWGASNDMGKLRSQIAKALECGCCGITVNGPDWLVHAPSK